MRTTRASAFESGGGEMGARMRAFDWAATPLGPIAGWPAVLRITVDQMLASKFPACLFWGPDLIAVYNDGYRPILGHKPEALGRPMHETWAEAWPQLEPIARRALAGESTFIEDYLVRTDRHGAMEDAWFTFNYGPVFDEQGRVVGMLDTVVETTRQVLARERGHAERERQRALLRQTPGFAAVLTGPEHVFEFVNDAYVAIAGARDFIGRPVREVFPELVGQGFFEALDASYATGRPFRGQALPVSLNRAGGQRAIDLLYEPIRDAAGQVEGIFVGGYDVTEHLAAERRLRESEARLQALNTELEQRVAERTLARGRAWEVSPEMLCVVGASGRFEAANPAWQKTLGWTETELAASDFHERVHPDDQAASRAAWAAAIQSGEPLLHVESRYRARQGGWRWLSWVAVPEDGKVYGIARDVTEEKSRRVALVERTAERDVYATLFHTTDVFIQVLDLDFRFLAINEANAAEYERIYGFRPRAGDRLPDLLEEHPEHRDLVLALWSRAMTGESFTEQAELGLPGRERRIYEMKFDALRAPDGRQIGAFHISTDATDRHLRQRALADMQETLRQSQKMEAIGQLTGGIAHDFNNLLGTISNGQQILRFRLQSGHTADLERYLDIIERSVQRAAALTQRLLAFARRQTLDPRPTDVNRLLRGMVDMVRRTVGPAVKIVLAQGHELWATRVDAPQLENAVLNLCINARDAMPDGGTITLSTHNAALDASSAADLRMPAGPYVCVRVSDAGTGMPPEVIERMFDPFFTTKPLGQGTGLGLSMVHGFVHQSGGHIRVRSTVGLGTTVALYLPRDGGAVAKVAASAPPDEPAGGRGQTVLLVEDEDDLRKLVCEVLEAAGYRMLAAADGPQGLRHVQGEERIDMLVTDVGLPGGMNGRQLADAGRAVRPAMQVLFITGYADAAAVGAHGLLGEGMALITKPFDVRDLVAKVNDMLA